MADLKITELTELDATPASSDLVALVDDPLGSPITKKITVKNFSNAPVSKAMTAGETINGATLPVSVYQDTADNKFKACDADDVDKLTFVGFAVSNSTDGNAIDIQFNGIVSGFTGLSEGEKYYVQDDKTIGTSVGTYEVLVGIAISETQLLIIKGAYEYIDTEAVSASEAAADSVDTATMPANARTAIIDIDFNSWTVVGAEASARGLLIIKRKGITSTDLWITGTGANSIHKVRAALSTNTITITVTQGNGTSLSGNIYYYS